MRHSVTRISRPAPAGLTSLVERTLRETDRVRCDPYATSVQGIQEDPETIVLLAQQVLGRHMESEKFALTLMGIFSGVALLLAAIGVYGILSYSVSQRIREFGIRTALGATTGAVRRRVLAQGAILAGLGLLTGLLGAFWLSKLLQSMVFGVSVTDPAIFALVTVILALVALAAGYVPARRATKVTPMQALREE